MYQHQPRVHQVKGCLRQGITCNIVAPHFKVRELQSFEKSSIKIRNNDSPGGAHTIAEPIRDRSAATSYLQTVPPRHHTSAFQVAYRARIKHRGKSPKS